MSRKKSFGFKVEMDEDGQVTYLLSFSGPRDAIADKGPAVFQVLVRNADVLNALADEAMAALEEGEDDDVQDESSKIEEFYEALDRILDSGEAPAAEFLKTMHGAGCMGEDRETQTKVALEVLCRTGLRKGLPTNAFMRVHDDLEALVGKLLLPDNESTEDEPGPKGAPNSAMQWGENTENSNDDMLLFDPEQEEFSLEEDVEKPDSEMSMLIGIISMLCHNLVPENQRLVDYVVNASMPETLQERADELYAFICGFGWDREILNVVKEVLEMALELEIASPTEEGVVGASRSILGKVYPYFSLKPGYAELRGKNPVTTREEIQALLKKLLDGLCGQQQETASEDGLDFDLLGIGDDEFFAKEDSSSTPPAEDEFLIAEEDLSDMDEAIDKLETKLDEPPKEDGDASKGDEKKPTDTSN